MRMTVSAVPRPRAAVPMEPRQHYVNSASIDIQNCIKHLTEDDAYSNYKNSFEARKIRENDIKSLYRDEQLNEYNKQKNFNNGFDAIRNDTDEDREDKKKEKKWTLGGFFRRKCRKDADDSSDDSGDGRKGFLSRRKSKRDRRKPRSKGTANGFDVIIPQQKSDPVAVNGVGKTVDDLWGNGDVKNGTTNGMVRYICRHQNNGVGVGSPDTKQKNLLQVPRQSRRDSNLSRNSSGGSGSLEGRKGRKEVMARAEAKRDRMRDESSSEENESYHSSSSLNRLTADGRRARGRHSKRFSRDEEGISVQKENDFRVVKSDLETHRLPPNSRWIPRGCIPDSSDHENVRFNLMNHSATPSPARSPRAKQKQLHPNASLPLPNSYPVNTFPPGIHYPQGRTAPTYNGLFPSSKYIHAKDPQIHISQPLLNVNYRKNNRNSEFIQPTRRSTNEHSTNRKTLMDYEQFLSSCGSKNDKSASYDQDIHRASYFENDPSDLMLLQHPVTKVSVHGVRAEPSSDIRKRDPSPRDPRRIPGVNQYYDLPQRMRKSYENENGESVSVGSAANSLSIQHPNHQMVQRSSSGNSFCNGFDKDPSYSQLRSNSYQHIPSYMNQQQRGTAERFITSVPYAQNDIKYYRALTDMVTASPAIVQGEVRERYHHQTVKPDHVALAKSLPNGSIPNLRYYADQNPRSRNPIHITCNTTPSPTSELSTDSKTKSNSQVSVKEAIVNASDFWKLKDQENMLNLQLKKATNSSVKPPVTQKIERSRSSSPRSRESAKVKPEVRKIAEHANIKVLKEEANIAKVGRSYVDKTKMTNNNKSDLQSKLKCDSNLDDALNELESIYNSLRLGDGAGRDHHLVNKANQQDRSIKNEKNDAAPSLNQPVKRSFDAVYPSSEIQRAAQQKKTAVPDKVNDDMAYRRMNSKDRTTDSKKFPPQCYLRSSPALSPVMGENAIITLHKESSQEPDITYDDVVFRNIRHANSTLKIQDPQPPFGIPLGPITPAPNSDYLHATPKDRFRPSFTSSKVPDVVKDDLAFRNLRKDNLTANLPVVENSKTETPNNPNYLMQKKRAVRSLSANLYNLIMRESGNYPQTEPNNNILEKDCEKTQSLTDLTEKEGKRALEKRLKELKEEKNAKRAEFFELAKEQRRKRNSKSNLSWTELAHLNGDFENVPQINTSTETLTEDNENKKNDSRNIQQRLRVNFHSENSERLTQAPETKTYKSPVVELSKYPAAAPSSSLHANPFRESAPGSPLDEAVLEDLLSALEKEAKTASEDLGRQLVQLELSTTISVEKSLAEESTRRSGSVATEKSEDIARFSSLERRSRNNSLSEKEFEKPAAETVEAEKNEEETRSDEDVSKLTNEIIQITEELMRRESKRGSSASFEVVTDLSQILHEMEEATPKPKDSFQEVYEYNCGLRRGSETGEETKETTGRREDSTETESEEAEEAFAEKDIEREFEKLHLEVDSMMEANGSKDADDAVVMELIADVTSGSGNGSESYSPRPFPSEFEEVSSKGAILRCRDGSSGSSNGEGFGHA